MCKRNPFNQNQCITIHSFIAHDEREGNLREIQIVLYHSLVCFESRDMKNWENFAGFSEQQINI